MVAKRQDDYITCDAYTKWIRFASISQVPVIMAGGVRTPGTSWPVPRLRIGLVSWTVEVPAVSSSIELAAAIVAAHISHRIELSFDKVAVFS